MTTDRKPMTGRGADNRISKQDKYQKSSLKSSQGNFMRTFHRSKTSQLIASWDDANYLTIFGNDILYIADTTGNVDAATVVGAPFLNILDIAWETYYSNANLKDLVPAEEASWKLYWAAYAQIAFCIQNMYIFRTLLPAYTESDTVPGDETNITYLDQESFDQFLSSMTRFPAPKGCIDLAKIWANWIIEVAPEYEKHTLRIPPAYIVPFNTRYDLADLEAMRELLRANLGNFITHSKKFGLGVGKWADPVAPTIKSLADPDVIAFMNHVQFTYYDNQPATITVYPDGGFVGANLTTNYTNVEYFFKDNPNESVLHVLAPWFGTYDATNNPYGGCIIPDGPNAAEYFVNLSRVAQHGTGVDPISLTYAGTKALLGMLKAYDDANSAAFKVNTNGTNFSDAQDMAGLWKFALHNKLYFGTGRGATETNNDLLNYIGKLIT